jgi:hypothetical protein
MKQRSSERHCGGKYNIFFVVVFVAMNEGMN